jgi:DNA polymerase II small subunit/DNA polymerase delta subunit B
MIEVMPVQAMQNYLRGFPVRKLLIPGASDPVDGPWPQPPFAGAFLDGIPEIDATSNPAAFAVDGVSFVCSTGDAVSDVVSETCLGFHESQIAMLSWRLMAPTAPATVPYAPAVYAELLVFEELPNYFVCGGAERFFWTEVNGVNALSIPGFADTRTVVVLDLNTGQAAAHAFG